MSCRRSKAAKAGVFANRCKSSFAKAERTAWNRRERRRGRAYIRREDM